MSETVQKVLSCIVSYRDPSKIKSAVDNQLKLKRPANTQLDILVVDNSADVGYEEKISLVLKAHEVQYVALKENLGVAGAYKLAYEIAQKGHYDFLWLWDQDSKVPENALVAQLQCYRSATDNEKLGIVSPKIVDPSGNETHWLTNGAPWDLWALRKHRKSMDKLTAGSDFSTFIYNSGALVNMKMLKEIGAPNPDYFMDMVDFEYCSRAFKASWKIRVCANSVILHAAGFPEKHSVFGLVITTKNHPPLRFYYMAKNELLMAHDYADGPGLVIKAVCRLIIVSIKIFFEKNKKSKKLNAHLRGIIDGILNKRGKSHPQWLLT